MRDEFKRDEFLCTSEFHKQGKERLPKMKQDFSRVNASELESQDLTELVVRDLLESSNHFNEFDIYSMIDQLIPIPNTLNKFNVDNVFEKISKSSKINVKNNYFFYCYTSGLDCSLNNMSVCTVVDNQIEIDYPKPDSNYEFIITDYLRNKRPNGKIPTEMFIECASDSGSDGNPPCDLFNIIGGIKVSKIKPQKKLPMKKLLVTGSDNFGRGIQTFLSQQGYRNCYICKFNKNSIDIYKGVEYFGQTTFNDTYHSMSLEKSFSKLLLETGEFRSQLILKYARFILAARLLKSSDSAEQIAQLQKIKSNIVWSCTWKNWEYVGPNILTDLTAKIALETPINDLLDQGIELDAPISLIESVRNLIQLLDTYNCENSLKILDIYKTHILPGFNLWYQKIRQNMVI